MNTNELLHAMDELLPDDGIISDFSKFMLSNARGHNICIQLDDCESKTVPVGVAISIITKAVFKEYTKFAFGTYKVVVAVGGIDREKYGLITAKYCFATLYYSEDCKLITLDFHEQIR
jgi:hypothetical protein